MMIWEKWTFNVVYLSVHKILPLDIHPNNHIYVVLDIYLNFKQSCQINLHLDVPTKFL